MTRSTRALGALLGASLVANVLLLSSLSREFRGESQPAPRAVPAHPSPGDFPRPSPEEFEDLRKKNEELRARLADVEIDARAEGARSPSASSLAVSAFRERLRHLRASNDGDATEAELLVEIGALETDFQRFLLGRSKDPRAYKEALQCLYQQVLDRPDTRLSPQQSVAFTNILEEMERGLGGIQAETRGDHLIRELEVEKAMESKIGQLLSDTQKKSFQDGPLASILCAHVYSTTWFDQNDCPSGVASSWLKRYGLAEDQRPALEAAARVYVEAMTRLDSEYSPHSSPSPAMRHPDSYEYRIRALREQLAALRLLEPSLSAEQRDRVKTQEMHEYFLVPR